jgi:hypothetical protein
VGSQGLSQPHSQPLVVDRETRPVNRARYRRRLKLIIGVKGFETYQRKQRRTVRGFASNVASYQNEWWRGSIEKGKKTQKNASALMDPSDGLVSRRHHMMGRCDNGRQHAVKCNAPSRRYVWQMIFAGPVIVLAANAGTLARGWSSGFQGGAGRLRSQIRDAC